MAALYTAVCKMVVVIVIRLATHLWTLTPLWRAKQIPSRRCHGSYTNEKGLCSLFTRRVPVETTPHNPPLEILTVSAWHLLDGICLVRQSGVKVQRWVVSRMTIVTTILQTAVHFQQRNGFQKRSHCSQNSCSVVVTPRNHPMTAV